MSANLFSFIFLIFRKKHRCRKQHHQRNSTSFARQRKHHSYCDYYILIYSIFKVFVILFFSHYFPQETSLPQATSLSETLPHLPGRANII